MSLTDDIGPSSSLIRTVADDRPQLSKAFKSIAELVVGSPAKFMVDSIQEIATAAGVSEPSVVRFCRRYGYDGVAAFRIALAMSLAAERGAGRRPFLEPTVADKSFLNRDMKQAVAKAAVPLLEGDRSLILDSGSTVQMFAQELRAASGRIILTTGLNVVETLWGCSQHTIIIPGGTVRFEARAVTGRLVEQSVQSMRFDTVYFGADSIDPQQGLSTFNEAEAHQNAAMANASQRVVVLVDSTKFKAPGLHRFCPIERINAIVTDHNISGDVAGELRRRGVNLIIAESNA